jgi:hypothetical protein
MEFKLMVFLKTKRIMILNCLFLILSAGSALASEDYQRELRRHEGEELRLREEEISHGTPGTAPNLTVDERVRASMNNPTPEPESWTQAEINAYNSIVDPTVTKVEDINLKITNCPPRPKSSWEGKDVKRLACKRQITRSDKNLHVERLKNPNGTVIFNTTDVNCQNPRGVACNIQPSPSPTPTEP